MRVAHRIDVHHHVCPPAYREALHRIGVQQEGGVPVLLWSGMLALLALRGRLRRRHLA